MSWLALMLYTLYRVLYLQEASSSEVPATDQSNCLRLTTFNYHYTPTYRLADMDSDKQAPGITFNFSVRAESNAHLKLSSASEMKNSAVTVEVVIGAGGNTFSSVRRKPKKTARDYSVNTEHILSNKEMRSFSLVLNGTLLQMYSNTSSVPILYYEDYAVEDMSFIAFGAWNNVGVEWSFDCRGAQEPAAQPKDPLSRLKKTYWSQYDPFNLPIIDNGTILIDISLSLIHMNLNAKDALFTMRGMFDVEWIDQKLQWDPEQYGNITHLNFKHRVIWMPDFVLMDVPKADSSILEDKSVRLYHSGLVKWKSLGVVETWCNVDVTDWPVDQHTCDLHIGLRSHPDTVLLKLKHSPSDVWDTFHMKTLETTGSEWEVISITADETTIVAMDGASPQSFKLRITLRRIKTPFLFVFVIPLFASFIVLLSSYIIAPQHKSRLALVSACIVILYLLLIMEDNILPAHPRATPRIMKITSILLLMAILQLIFHCFNTHLVNLNIPAPAFMKNAAKKSWMNYIHKGAQESFVEEEVLQHEFQQMDHDYASQNLTESEGIDMNKYHWALVARGLDVFTFLLSFFILPFLLSPL